MGKKDTRYKGIPFEVVAATFKANMGNVSATCDKLGIDRSTFKTWCEKYPELNELIENCSEFCIDFAESKLMSAINEGNLTAIIFYLKTKGKKRGYIEGQEITATVHSAKPMTQQEAQDFINDLENKY